MTTPASVDFPSLHAAPLMVPGRLSLPEGAGPHPAVILLHGEGGPCAREDAYARVLDAAGFVTLAPDHASPRPEGRPTVHQTLGDVFGALEFLATRADVDARRIGLLGFGAGGAAALLAATRDVDRSFDARGRFAAFLAFYPVCHRFNREPGFELSDLVPAPVMIATAALDGYDDDPAAGPNLVKSLPALDHSMIRTAVFYGVHHAFDVPGPDRRLEDAAAHRGAGGDVRMAHDPEAAERAHELAARFFGEMRAGPPRR